MVGSSFTEIGRSWHVVPTIFYLSLSLGHWTLLGRAPWLWYLLLLSSPPRAVGESWGSKESYSWCWWVSFSATRGGMDLDAVAEYQGGAVYSEGSPVWLWLSLPPSPILSFLSPMSSSFRTPLYVQEVWKMLEKCELEVVMDQPQAIQLCVPSGEDWWWEAGIDHQPLTIENFVQLITFMMERRSFCPALHLEGNHVFNQPERWLPKILVPNEGVCKP